MKAYFIVGLFITLFFAVFALTVVNDRILSDSNPAENHQMEKK